MTRPRRCIRNATSKITRRTVLRIFFLRPGDALNNIFLYCLALAMSRFGVLVHGFVVMSNHYHLVVTDPKCELARFLHYLNYLLSRCCNAYLKRSGQLFQAGSYSAVAQTHEEMGLNNEDRQFLAKDVDYDEFDDVLAHDDKDIHEALHYLELNPVSARLVSQRSEWPGCISSYQDIASGKVFTAKKPEYFFSATNAKFPSEIEFKLDRLPSWEGWSDDEVKAECDRQTAAIDLKEEDLRRKFEEEGRSFLGRERVLAIDPNEVPKGDEEEQKVNPEVAGKKRCGRFNKVLKLRLLLVQAFQRAYRAAFVKWRDSDGRGAVTFPRGTYLLRYFHGVSVEHSELCVEPAAVCSLPT